MSPEELLQTALAAAQAADPIIRRYFESGAKVSLKPDRSPVTEADVAAEHAIRAVVEGRFPDHGFYGEETGRSREHAEVLWLVDPIDGTKGFVRGYPMFSTQIAVMVRGELAAGVSHAPMFEETCHALKGGGAYLNDRRISTSDVDQLPEAQISVGNLRSMSKSPKAWAALGEIVRVAQRARGYGDFYHYHLLASGCMDGVIESDVNILDIAAVALIVTEAGGVFTDLQGRRIGMDTTSVLAANGALHPVLLDRFQAALRSSTSQ